MDTPTDDNVTLKWSMAHIVSSGTLLIAVHETLTYPHPPVTVVMLTAGISVKGNF